MLSLQKRKRGQLKIQQMAFVLIAVTVFFAIIGMFFLVLKLNSLGSAAETLEERNALLLATKLANSPEFSCGASFGNQKINCVDLDKMLALKENIETYDSFWEVENIEVKILYPKQEQDISCSKETYPNCNSLKLRDKPISGFDASNFVTVCKKITINGGIRDVCELGKLLISY